MARPIARLKLGYFPLPVEEAQNIRALLLPQHRMRPSIPVSATVRR